jgi:hypothetical protein
MILPSPDFLARSMDAWANWNLSRRAMRWRPSRNLEKRIEALESRMLSDAVILHFADGSTKEIRGPRGFLLKLFAGLSGEHLDPEQAEQFELVRRCIRAEEPGGGRLIAMLKALTPEPAEDGRSASESFSAVCSHEK